MRNDICTIWDFNSQMNITEDQQHNGMIGMGIQTLKTNRTANGFQISSSNSKTVVDNLR